MTDQNIDTETDDEETTRLWTELQKNWDNTLTERELLEDKWQAENRRTPSFDNRFKQKPGKIANPRPLMKRNRTGDDYKIMYIPKGTIMNEKFRKTMNDCLTIYLYLKANIIRGRLLQDPLKIYKNYYEKGFLAASFTEDYLADTMGLSRYQVRKQLNKLHEAGIIKKDMIQTGKNKRNCVYVLGTHQFIGGERKERFYIEDFIDENMKKV